MFGKVDKEQYQAIIYTNQFKISGTIHLLAEERMTDYLGDQDNIFVPITGASVHSLTGEPITDTDFLCLNKSKITLLVPVE